MTTAVHTPTRDAHLRARIADIDWTAVTSSLDARGYSVLPGLLSPAECDTAIACWEEPVFRKRIVMAQKGYGAGEYQYFAYPLPPLVATLREALYSPLVGIANGWWRALGRPEFPPTLAEFSALCHAAEQRRPTPLLLRYEAGDFNCLHQDVYGALMFPLQAAILLSEPGQDFTGGEFVLTEQRPRMQSRVEVVPLARGDAVIFAVRERPRAGARGIHRVNMRHGVSPLRGGHRFTLGIIFHDAA
jgi:hypothetical protein